MKKLNETFTETGDGLQKQTHITLSNPNHPETSVDYADPETIEEHFRAAKAIKNSHINRRLVVGEFLVALENEILDGEEGAVEEFMRKLSG